MTEDDHLGPFGSQRPPHILDRISSVRYGSGIDAPWLRQWSFFFFLPIFVLLGVSRGMYFNRGMVGQLCLTQVPLRFRCGVSGKALRKGQASPRAIVFFAVFPDLQRTFSSLT